MWVTGFAAEFTASDNPVTTTASVMCCVGKKDVGQNGSVAAANETRPDQRQRRRNRTHSHCLSIIFHVGDKILTFYVFRYPTHYYMKTLEK